MPFCHGKQKLFASDEKKDGSRGRGELLKKEGPSDKEAQEEKKKTIRSKEMMQRNVVELERDLRGVSDRKHSRSLTLCPSWVSSSTSAPADG